jgi:hypothetical protein
MPASSILVAYGARWVYISRCTRVGGGSKFLGSASFSRLERRARLVSEWLDLGHASLGEGTMVRSLSSLRLLADRPLHSE